MAENIYGLSESEWRNITEIGYQPQTAGTYLPSAINTRKINNAQAKQVTEKPVWEAPILEPVRVLASGTIRAGADALNTIRTFTGTSERVIAGLSGDYNKSASDIARDIGTKFATGDIAGGVKQSIPFFMPTLAAVPEMVSLSANVIDRLFNGDFSQLTQSSGLKDAFGTVVAEELKQSKFGGILSPELNTDVDKALLPAEKAVMGVAETIPLTEVGEAIAGGIGSLPTSLIAQGVPYKLGYAILGVKSFRNTVEQLAQRQATTGERFSDSDILLNATGNMALEIGTEMLFPLLGKGSTAVTKKLAGTAVGKLLGSSREIFPKLVAKIAGKTALQTGKVTLRELAASMLVATVGEGAEEVINALGSGLVAKMTTDPDAKYFGAPDEALVSWKALALAYISGASGAAVTVGGQTILNNMLTKIGDKQLNELTESDVQVLDETIATLAHNSEMQNRLIQDGIKTIEFAQKVSENNSIKTIDDLINYAPNKIVLSESAKSELVEKISKITVRSGVVNIGEYKINVSNKQESIVNTDLDKKTITVGKEFFNQTDLIKTDLIVREISKESELVKESQLADVSNRLGIIGVPFGVQKQTTEEPAWKRTISDKTKSAIDRASKPYAGQNIITKLKENVLKFREFVTLGSVPIDTKYGDVRRLFRESRASSQYAKGVAENIIAKSYNKAGTEKQELLRYALLYLDIKEDLANGFYSKDTGLQFDITSPEEALSTIEAIEKELNKPENELVVEAIETRKRLMNEVRDELIAVGKTVGIDFSHIKARTNYMYHAILEYQEEFNQALKAKGTKKGTGKAEYLARTGSVLDYISDPIMSDFLILQKLLKDTAKVKLYAEIKKHDISNTLNYSEENDWRIPDGYSELSVAKLGIVHYDAIDKSIAKSAKIAELEKRGIDHNSPQGRKLIAKAVTVLNKNTIVVPTQMVDAVTREFATRETTIGGQVTKSLMNMWKYSKIRLPNSVIKYNARNFFGDLDAVIAGRPSALFKMPKAISELYKYFYKKGVMTEQLKNYIKKSGMTTGQTPQELKTLKMSNIISAYGDDLSNKGLAKTAIRKIWKAATLETFTNFREQVLRYATYLSYSQELNSEKTNGLPKSYAASIPSEIQSIKNIDDRAFKLSNDLVGAYDDVSIFGQWAADHLMPFYRFTEVNAKRYYRMTRNIFYSDPSSMDSVAKDVVSKATNFTRVGGVAMFRAAKLYASLFAFYGALALCNAVFAPEEEKELPEDVRNSPHLTVPRWVTGTEKIYYIDRLGSFAELLDIFGIGYRTVDDIKQIATGRKKLSDVLSDVVSSPLNYAFNSAWPAAKIAYELITGKTYYPDPKTPAQIRDVWEYLFGQVGLKTEYKAIAGKPLSEGSYWNQKREVLWNSVIPGDAAIYDVYDMIDDYYDIKNKSRTYTSYRDSDTAEYKRSNSAYYYKLSLRLNDPKAAEKYLAEFVSYGGTKQNMQQSLNYIDPIYGMSKTDRAEFLEWITPEQKERYNQAKAWHEELSKLNSESVFPSK